MSLIDDLRKIHLPPSHLPTVNEVADLLGALAGYAEHGENLLKAAERDAKALDAGEPATAVNDLLSPPPEAEPAAAPVAATPAPVSSPSPVAPVDPVLPAGAAPDDRDAKITELEQQLANLRADAGRTQATVVPVEPAPEGL